MILGPLTLAASVIAGQTSTPIVQCEVQLRAWCINQSSAALSMFEDGSTRIWVLELPYLRRPLRVLEETRCANRALGTAAKRRTVRVRGESANVVYEIDVVWPAENECHLRVEVPGSEAGPFDEALSAANSLIRICIDPSCVGPSLGQLSVLPE